ncbi:MAG: hypothetical protein ACPLYX_11220 [Rectinema subterraneum]|uniref:hypothetical protein n=1 Tax=Rectinema subterraneum TaxID=2653714 RepID=UPI003C7ED58B
MSDIAYPFGAAQACDQQGKRTRMIPSAILVRLDACDQRRLREISYVIKVLQDFDFVLSDSVFAT